MSKQDRRLRFRSVVSAVIKAGATQVLEVREHVRHRTADNKRCNRADGMFDLAATVVASHDDAVTSAGWAAALTKCIDTSLQGLEGSPYENPVASRKENYNDFDEWETDAFRAGATQVVRLGEVPSRPSR
jgi:hypothetical protein